MIKEIIIPVAAFAVTATGVSAFSTDQIRALDVDLTEDQIAALEIAHEARIEGSDRSEIRTILEEAGIDRELRQEIRSAVRDELKATRAAIKEAVAAENYDSFLAAAEGTRVGAVVDTESEFAQLIEAQALREAGDREGARAIMAELGFEKPDRGERGPRGGDRN